MRVEWIQEEAGELVGIGVFKKNDRFDIPDKLAEQLIYQGLVKDAYVTKEDRKKRKLKNKEDK